MTIIETSDIVIVPLPELPGTQSISLSAPGGALHIHYDMGTYVIGLPPGCRLICTLNDATEEQAEEIVAATCYPRGECVSYKYQNYTAPDSFYNTALASLRSLAESKGVKGNAAFLKRV